MFRACAVWFAPEDRLSDMSDIEEWMEENWYPLWTKKAMMRDKMRNCSSGIRGEMTMCVQSVAAIKETEILAKTQEETYLRDYSDKEVADMSDE